MQSDKAAARCLRYSCGHTACEECASGTENCFFCLTPPEKSSSYNFAFDDVSTQRATNASALLNAFEKAFQVDVYRRQRMSDQLKLEKELFPGCIQAPNKYSNRRKKSNTFIKKKENRLSKLPGEVIYPAMTTKMTDSINSVEQWLNQNKENATKNQNVSNKDENDESGIVLDGSVIDCSQITEDKDRKALLAVYAADKNEQIFDSALTIESEKWDVYNDNKLTLDDPKILKDKYTVPFFKKSMLAKTCAVCDNDNNIIKIRTNMCDETKNIQITIQNHNQSIQLNEVVQKRTSPAHSIPVQTDISEMSKLKKNTRKGYMTLEDMPENKSLCFNIKVHSQDVFTSDEIYKDSITNTPNIDSKIVKKSIVITESDSEDGSVTEAEIQRVTAEVHRFQDPVIHGVLTNLDCNEILMKTSRRRPRGLTPDSSNSSEKENCDPCRPKKSKCGKKNDKK